MKIFLIIVGFLFACAISYGIGMAVQRKKSLADCSCNGTSPRSLPPDPVTEKSLLGDPTSAAWAVTNVNRMS